MEVELHQLANEISVFVVSEQFHLIADEVMQEDLSQIPGENPEEDQSHLKDFQPQQMNNGNIGCGTTFDFSQTISIMKSPRDPIMISSTPKTRGRKSKSTKAKRRNCSWNSIHFGREISIHKMCH